LLAADVLGLSAALMLTTHGASRLAREGKLWISSLYSHLFANEHRRRFADMES
jgi:hypothetical protein